MAQKQGLKIKNVLILASGNGSNFEAIVKYFRSKGLGQVNFELVCDNNEAYALKRAQNLGVRASWVPFSDLHKFLECRQGFDLVVLAGFMRILPREILDLCGFRENKIVNIHPSLLPRFKGKNAIKRAFEANVRETGVTVHFVDERLDGGKIIEKRAVQAAGLSYNALESAIHAVEHAMYPEIIEKLLFKRHVMLVGSGARENAIAERLANSPYLEKLYLAGANDGFRHLGENICYDSYLDLFKKAKENDVDLLVVGPENPLCEGIADIFLNGGISVIGANKKWAALEGSKLFAKKFMAKYGIKTADYRAAKDKKSLDEAFAYFKESKSLFPPVIKADGLALGKGVSVPEDWDEAYDTAKAFLAGKFGAASMRILLEERLSGVEVSIMSLWDGKTLVSFPPASDYKRLLDGNLGENTGGMGAYAPSRISKTQKIQISSYLKALESALTSAGANFCGVIYSGLILTRAGVRVLEYNIRFGDPEIQALLELLDEKYGGDLLNIFIKMTQKRLSDLNLKFKKVHSYVLTLASSGYPVSPLKGEKITGLENASKYGCKVYYAGVKSANDGANAPCGASQNSANRAIELVTAGGRVLSIVKSAANGKKALKDIYNTADIIDFKGKIFRTDIGKA